MRCRVCRNDSNLTFYDVREMMHGTKEPFTYFQCSRCLCLQITDIPPDMTPYYPPHYIGFNKYNPQYTAKLGIPLWANTMDFSLIEDVLRGVPPAEGECCGLVKRLTTRAVTHYLPFIRGNHQCEGAFRRVRPDNSSKRESDNAYRSYSLTIPDARWSPKKQKS